MTTSYDKKVPTDNTPEKVFGEQITDASHNLLGHSG